MHDKIIYFCLLYCFRYQVPNPSNRSEDFNNSLLSKTHEMETKICVKTKNFKFICEYELAITGFFFHLYL